MNKLNPQQLMTLLAAGELRNGEVIIRVGNDYITGIIQDITISHNGTNRLPTYEISGFVLNPE